MGSKSALWPNFSNQRYSSANHGKVLNQGPLRELLWLNQYLGILTLQRIGNIS